MRKTKYLHKKRNSTREESIKKLSNNKKIQFNSTNLEDIIFINREKKAKEMFQNQFKKESDKLKQLEIIKEIIKLDDVEEEYIFYFIKLLKECNIKFNILFEVKNIIMRLSENHYYELNLTSQFNYINHKTLYLEELDLISFYNTNNNYKKLIEILENKNEENKKYFSVINKELEVNMPITFKKNENLMYFLLRDFIINSFIEHKNNNEYLLMKIFDIKNKITLLKSISEKSEKEQNLIFFTLVSLTKKNNINNCFLKFENTFSLQELLIGKKNNLTIKDNILSGTIEINDNKIDIKIFNIHYFHLNSIFYYIDSHKFYFNEINEMYNNTKILQCVKIEYMNKFNYYSSDFENLKTIIFEIASSKSIDEYINQYTDYISDLNILKNRKFFDDFWEKNINFIPFERDEGFEAESLRAFCIINFSSLPLLSYDDYEGIEISLFRLFNYTKFVASSLHEFEGHLNKMILWLYNKSIQVKTIECPNDLKLNNYNYDIRDENDAGNIFNVFKTSNKINNNFNFINSNNENDDWKKKTEGGYNFEIVFFNFILGDIITINQMLFILNSNNYESLRMTNFFPYLYISYKNAFKESKIKPDNFNYLNLENVSQSFKNLLNKYHINEEFLLLQDDILIKNISKDFIVKGKTKKVIYRSKIQRRRGHCQIHRYEDYIKSN